MACGPDNDNLAAGDLPRRLCYFNAGFLRQKRLRRILELAGCELHAGRVRNADAVLVWGRSPYAARGERIAARHGLPVLRIEDAFLRSIAPGRSGEPPIGLIADPIGVYFDAAHPSRLEQILALEPLDDPDLLSRAEQAIARLGSADLSKYNQHDPDLAAPEPGYILVVDQTRGDASIRDGGANAETFDAMLRAARSDHPQARIVIKAHPETRAGFRPGHFGAPDLDARTIICDKPVSPRRLLNAAAAVYTVTSQLGFEAILAGHRPQVFGGAFYAGWGLSDDRVVLARRRRKLSAAQLFAGAMIRAPLWYDPCRNRLCSLEEAIDQLEAMARAWREDRNGYVATAMRLWKRRHLRDFYGQAGPLRFADPPARAAEIATDSQRPLMIWAGRASAPLAPDLTMNRIEDGFLRSRGLGAELIPPLSLVSDDLGIYYDPTRESRLEHLIATPLPPGGEARARRIIATLTSARLSKYNLAGKQPDLPAGHKILVPGQVEDDASIRLGAGSVRHNKDLLRATRAAYPDAIIVYKPHPDVEAGLRPGAINPAELLAEGLATVIADHSDPVALIEACDEVWTITSLTGFEALLRGRPVTCLGAPFYAGWGLTRDLDTCMLRALLPDLPDIPSPIPARRQNVTGITTERLAHAALIAYPRYFDPVSRMACPPEVVLERLASGNIPRRSAGRRLLSKLQGLLASRSSLWRG